MPRLKHFEDLGDARFITFSCFQRYPYLRSASCRNVVVDELTLLQSQHAVRILGWVLIADHVHFILWPPESSKLGRLIGQLKGRSARRILKLHPNANHRRRSDGRCAVWQRRCYDHNCRKSEVVREKLHYCHMNPVKAGLVRSPQDWPWSSYRYYAGYDDALLEIDAIDL